MRYSWGLICTGHKRYGPLIKPVIMTEGATRRVQSTHITLYLTKGKGSSPLLYMNVCCYSSCTGYSVTIIELCKWYRSSIPNLTNILVFVCTETDRMILLIYSLATKLHSHIHEYYWYDRNLYIRFIVTLPDYRIKAKSWSASREFEWYGWGRSSRRNHRLFLSTFIDNFLTCLE